MARLILPISHSEKKCCISCSVISLNCSFLTSKYGLIKILQILLLLVGVFLVFDIGKSEHRKPLRDEVYFTFSTTISMAFFQTITFIVVYILSERSFRLVRSSLFEMVSSTLVLLAFIYSCFFVAFKSNFFTDPLRFLNWGDDTSETLLYYTGSFLVLIYGFDTFLAVMNYFSLKKEQSQKSIFRI